MYFHNSSEQAECVLNKQFEESGPEDLPGEQVGTGEQCKQIFGPTSGACQVKKCLRNQCKCIENNVAKIEKDRFKSNSDCHPKRATCKMLNIIVSSSCKGRPSQV